MEMVKELKPKKNKKKTGLSRVKIDDSEIISLNESTKISEVEEKSFTNKLNVILKSSEKEIECDTSKSQNKNNSTMPLSKISVTQSIVDNNIETKTVLNEKCKIESELTLSSPKDEKNEKDNIGNKNITCNKANKIYVETLKKVSVEAITLERNSSVNVANVYPNLKSLSHRETLEAIQFLHSQVSAYKEEYKRHLFFEANEKYKEFCNYIHGIENDYFFGLIEEYHKARKSALELESRIKYLNSNLKRKKDKIWYIDKKKVSSQGRCRDGYGVAVSHVYEIKVLDEERFKEVLSHLKSLEECIEQNIHFAYTKQLISLKIEQYLHSIISTTKNFDSGFLTVESDRLIFLKRCISALFSFQRQPSKDRLFLEICQKWLKLLVSELFQYEDFSNNIFVLNHVIRSPNGVKLWASDLVQLPWPLTCVNGSRETLNCHCLNFLLLVLYLILNPAPDREIFLKNIKLIDPPDPLDGKFTAFDSDGEEEELFEVAKEWSDEDLVSLLDQISVAKISHHILGPKESELIRKNTSEVKTLKLFAFSTTLLEVLFSGLEYLKYEKYAESVEHICFMIRNITCYISDYWSYNRDSVSPDLQAVYDKFFFGVVFKIFHLKKCGVWKFLSALPFENVSKKLLWQIIWIFHSPNINEDEAYIVKDVDRKLSDDSISLLFKELENLEENNQIYFLAFYESIAINGNPEDSFLQFIIHEVFEISFVEGSLQFLAKEGKILFKSIIQKYPTLMTCLLKEINSREDDVVKLSVDIFEELSLDVWVPQIEDINIISKYLLSRELSSAKNCIARILLSKMNWRLSPEGHHILPLKLHREVAVLVLQAYVKFDKNGNEWSVSRGINQMLQYTSFKNVLKDESFVPWAWNILFSLKLHALDSKFPQWIEIYDGLIEIDDLPNPFDDPWLQPLFEAYEAKHPVACYLMLVMTNIGHNVEKLMTHGLECLISLIANRQYLASIHSLYYVMPFFVKRTDELLAQSQFILNMGSLMVADVSVLPNLTGETVIGAVLHKVGLMIKHQISQAGNLTVECTLPLIKLWIKILLKISTIPYKKTYQFKDSAQQIFYLLEIVLKVSYFDSYTRENAMDLMYSFGNPLLNTSQNNQSSFWNKCFGINQEFFPILHKEILPDYPWLAFAIIWAETEQKHIQDLFQMVQKEIYADENITPANALKKSSSFFKITLPPLESLPIYRWSKQIISTNCDHPCLPLMWQQFFIYYFERISPHSKVPKSLGHLYFKGENSKVLFEKLKCSLQKSVEFFYKSLQKIKITSSSTNENSSEFENCENKNSRLCAFYIELYRIFKAFSLWLSDNNLHKSSVCFSALDPKYSCDRLKLVLNNDKHIWYDLVSVEDLKINLDEKLQTWMAKKLSFSSLSRSPSNDEKLFDRISKHSKNSTTKDLVCEMILEPISQEITEVALSSWETLVKLNESNQNIIFEKARSFTDLFDKLKQLNFSYENLVPQEYEVHDIPLSMKKECLKGSKCIGSAEFTLMISEYNVNKRIKENLERNQIDYHIVQEKLLSFPVNQLCSASIHIENYITVLSSKMKTADGAEISKVRSMGESLFFHELKTIDKALISVSGFSPSKQFFSSSIESLGKVFMLEREEQLLPLAKAIVDYQYAGELVSNLFNPHIAPISVLPDLYETVLYAVKNNANNAAFVLLSKIDIHKILKDSEPNISIRKKVFQSICSTLLATKFDTEKDSLPLYDICKKHFSILLTYMFPDLYNEATKLCIEGMENGEIPVDIFYETICCIGCLKLNEHSTINEIKISLKQFAENLLLPPDQQIFVTSHSIDIFSVKNTLDLLYKRLREKRNSENLYQCYKKHLKPYGLYIALLNHSLILLLKDNAQKSFIVYEIWKYLEQSFSLWIHPFEEASHLKFPWSDEQIENARYMFQLFTTSLTNLDEILCEHANIKSSLLSCCWNEYVDVYVKPSFRHYAVSLCHTEYINFPWHQFYPNTNDIEGMCIVLQSDLFENKEFLAKISLKIPWFDLVRNIAMTETTEYVRKILATLGKLLIISGLDVSLTQSNAHKNKIKFLEELPWNFLTLDEVESLLSLYYTTYNPLNIIGDDLLNCPNYYILQFLRIICCMTVSLEMKDITLPQAKRLLYLHNYCLSIVKNLSDKESPIRRPENLKKVLPSLLEDIDNIIQKTILSDKQMSCSITLVREIFGLINNMPEATLEKLTVNSIISYIKSHKTSPLLLPCLQVACQSLSQAANAVKIAECCIATCFNIEISNPDDATKIWDVILNSFQVEISSRDEFIYSCVNKNAFFILYCHVLDQLPKLYTVDSKKLLLVNIVDWINRTDMKDLKDSDETKCLLLWDKVLELSLILINEDEHQIVRKALESFCKRVLILGEDKSNSGIWSALGLGAGSPFSVNFRFLCRMISSFVLLQIPVNAAIRIEPMATGYISSKKLLPNEPSPNPLAIQSLDILRALLKNKSYAALQDTLKHAIEFVINPRNCLLDSRQFLKTYSLLVFPKQSYLYALGM